MAKRGAKKPEYPEESRICGLIFICQLIAVLSAVSIVYLTVASYAPSIKAITSTYEESSVNSKRFQQVSYNPSSIQLFRIDNTFDR